MIAPVKLSLNKPSILLSKERSFSFARIKPNGQLALMNHIGNPISIPQILMSVDYKKTHKFTPFIIEK